MHFLQHVDALIVDLRENGGGAPATVAYVTSYLFEKPTHLNDIYDRRGQHPAMMDTAARSGQTPGEAAGVTC